MLAINPTVPLPAASTENEKEAGAGGSTHVGSGEAHCALSLGQAAVALSNHSTPNLLSPLWPVREMIFNLFPSERLRFHPLFSFYAFVMAITPSYFFCAQSPSALVLCHLLCLTVFGSYH
jgi:hypothetical protein